MDRIIKRFRIIKSQVDQKKPLSRDTVLIATFGAVWGLMEITLGVTIKGLRIPMGGALLTAISAIIFLTGRYFIRRRGAILMMGMMAAILKIFSVGTVIIGPFMAILIEALIAEILISFLGIHRISYVLTSILLSLYTLIHPFIAQGVIFGDNIYKIYLEMFEKMAEFLQTETISLLWIVLSYVLLHVMLGAFAGWMAFSLPKKVEKEIGQYYPTQ